MTKKKAPPKPKIDISKVLQGFKGLDKPEFKIKNTKFDIEKLPIMQNFELAEKIREQMAFTANNLNTGSVNNEEDGAILFFKTILSLPPVFIEELRVAMFNHISFSGSGVEKGHMPLLGAEDMAFNNCEIIHIYEVIARALYINFSGSFSGLMSAIPGGASILSQLNQ